MADSYKAILKQGLFVGFCVVCASCGDDDVNGPVIISDVSIDFRAFVGSEAASCQASYSNVGTTTNVVQLADARMFISNVQLRAADGTWTPVSLNQNSWQYRNVALLDFEDGCGELTTTDTNTTITGTITPGFYDGVRFDIGVPFDLNHNELSSSPAPLNTPGMFWVWRGGHKFLRVDWLVDGGAVPRWNVHIGSTACFSDSLQTPPDQPCGRPNIASVELSSFVVGVHQVDVDLAAILAGSDLGSDLPDTPSGCQSSPAEGADCSPVFASLGMDFITGTASTTVQRVFSVSNL